MKRTRILLADDHAVVIEGLHRILERPEFEIVGAVSDGHALVKSAAVLQPDITITDVAMPLLNGIEAAGQIRQQNPESKIIFLTMHPEELLVRQALAAGGCGYVLKSSAGDELITAINEALDGRVYVTESIAGALKQSLQAEPMAGQSPIDELTHRQREVLQLLADGHQAKEIAATLNVSPKTVEFHKYRLMDVLGIRTIAQLARYAAKNGIVDLSDGTVAPPRSGSHQHRKMKRQSFKRQESEERSRNPQWDREIKSFSQLRGPKRKVPIIFDENVEEELVETVRTLKKQFRIIELKKGADDSVIWQEGKRKKAVIVTSDASDFWNDKKFPLHDAPLVIVLRSSSAEQKLVSFLRAILEWNVIENYRRVGPPGLKRLKIKASSEHTQAKWWNGTSLVTIER